MHYCTVDADAKRKGERLEPFGKKLQQSKEDAKAKKRKGTHSGKTPQKSSSTAYTGGQAEEDAKAKLRGSHPDSNAATTTAVRRSSTMLC
jgi:hypothetical protein